MLHARVGMRRPGKERAFAIVEHGTGDNEGAIEGRVSNRDRPRKKTPDPFIGPFHFALSLVESSFCSFNEVSFNDVVAKRRTPIARRLLLLDR